MFRELKGKGNSRNLLNNFFITICSNISDLQYYKVWNMNLYAFNIYYGLLWNIYYYNAKNAISIFTQTVSRPLHTRLINIINMYVTAIISQIYPSLLHSHDMTRHATYYSRRCPLSGPKVCERKVKDIDHRSTCHGTTKKQSKQSNYLGHAHDIKKEIRSSESWSHRKWRRKGTEGARSSGLGPYGEFRDRGGSGAIRAIKCMQSRVNFIELSGGSARAKFRLAAMKCGGLNGHWENA